MVLVATAAAANGGNSRHTAGGRTYTEFSERQAVIYNRRNATGVGIGLGGSSNFGGCLGDNVGGCFGSVA